MVGASKVSIAVLALFALVAPALGEATPVSVDAAPVSVETNSVVAAAAIKPGCALYVSATASAEADCVDMTDAAPTQMTVNGPVSLAGTGDRPASEDALLLSLGARHQDLDAEKASLDQQALLLDAAEKRIAEREAKLAALEGSINKLVDTRDAQEQAKIDEMVALYGNMKPRDAAAVMGGLPDDVLLKIASNIPARKMSAIMAAMNPARAQALTVLMVDQTSPAQP